MWRFAFLIFSVLSWATVPASDGAWQYIVYLMLVLCFGPVRCLGFSVGTVVGVSVWAIGVLRCPERPSPLN